MVGVGKKAQFFIVTMIVVTLALILILGYATIAREIKISSLQGAESISRDVSSLQIDASEVKKKILEEWFDFRFTKRVEFKVTNNEYQRNLWIFSKSLYLPKSTDFNSIRLVDSENFEIPSQVYVENETLGKAKLIFLDSLDPLEEKEYKIYFKYEEEEPRIGKPRYRPLVVISEKADEFVIDTLSYIVHVPKGKGGTITDLYVKDYLNNSVYKEDGFYFQSKVEYAGNVFTQENCENADFEVLENGPYLGVLKVSCSHKDQTGSTITGESFTQYQYYYPTYILIEEKTNFENQISGNYTFFFFLNSTTFQSYNDSLGNSLTNSLQDLGEIDWFDFYNVNFGVGAKLLSSPMNIKGRSTASYEEIRLEDFGLLKGEYEKRFIVYPHLGNFSEVKKFSDLYSHKPTFLFGRVEDLNDIIDEVTDEIFLSLKEKGYSIFANFSVKEGLEDFSSQPDWEDPNFRHRIVLNLIPKGSILRPIKLKFNGTVNFDSIKVVDDKGLEVGYQISQEIVSPASFEEKFRCESGATNEFYLLNLDGRDFLLNVEVRGFLSNLLGKICVYYPNLSLVGGECFSLTETKWFMRSTIPGMKGIYKVIVNISVPGEALGVSRSVFISTSLPKMVVSGNLVNVDVSSSGGDFFFHVPENKESFSIEFLLPSGGGPTCNLSILDESLNLIKEIRETDQITMEVENFEGGSFYYLRYNCSDFGSDKYFQINFTNVSKSIGNDKEHWFDFENPELYFFFSREFKIGEPTRLYIYYNTVSECFGSYDNPVDLGCPKVREKVSTDLLRLPNLTISNSHYKISFQSYSFFRLLKGYWFDKNWQFRRKIVVEEKDGIAKEGTVEIKGITIGEGKVKNCSREVRVTAIPGFWNFRRKVEVREVGGIEEKNVSLNLTIPHNGHAQSDCRDVYLFNEDLELFPYRILKCNSTHVVIKSLLNLSANSTNYLYVYYGNNESQVPSKRFEELEGNEPVAINISLGEEEINPPQAFEEIEIPRGVKDEVYSESSCVNFTLLLNTSLHPNQVKTYYLYYGNEFAEQPQEISFGTPLSGIDINLSREENLASENWFVEEENKVLTLTYILDPTLLEEEVEFEKIGSPTATQASGTGWYNPEGAYSDDDDAAYASSSISGATQRYYNFGLNIPKDATITKVIVKVKHKETSSQDSVRVSISWDGGSSWARKWLSLSYDAYRTDDLDFTSSTSWTPEKLNDSNLVLELYYHYSPWLPPCYPGNTYVTYWNGSLIRVTEVKPGDIILGASLEGELTPLRVEDLQIHSGEWDIYKIYVIDPDSQESHYISLTGNHQVYVEEEGELIPREAKDVKVGNLIPVLKGRNVTSLPVVKVERLKYKGKVFNVVPNDTTKVIFIRTLENESRKLVDDPFLTIDPIIPKPLTAYVDWLAVSVTYKLKVSESPSQNYTNFSNVYLVDDGSLRKIVGMSAGTIKYSAEFYAWNPMIKIKVFSSLERSAIESTWNLRTDGTDDVLLYLKDELRSIPLNLSFKDVEFKDNLLVLGKGDYNSILGVLVGVDSMVPSNDFLKVNGSSISIKLRNDGEFYFIVLDGEEQELQKFVNSLNKMRYTISNYKVFLKFVKKGQILIVS